MNKPYQLLLALGIAAASLSSCSKANYVLNTTTAPTAESVSVAEATSDAAATGTAMVTATMPTDVVAPAREAGAALAHRAVPTQVQAQPKAASAATAAEAETTTKTVLTKAERKALRQELKHQMATSPKEVAADGKNQYTALFLCIFLGSIGVHQFYLGYTGRGFLRIALFITSFLILPAIANLILYVLDIIKISKGTLKPRNGDYGTKFKGSN